MTPEYSRHGSAAVVLDKGSCLIEFAFSMVVDKTRMEVYFHTQEGVGSSDNQGQGQWYSKDRDSFLLR